MISAQTRSVFVATESRFALFRIMPYRRRGCAFWCHAQAERMM